MTQYRIIDARKTPKIDKYPRAVGTYPYEVQDDAVGSFMTIPGAYFNTRAEAEEKIKILERTKKIVDKLKEI